ncbi:hypothetical protein DEA8626_02386 [Defluviimonas aquaemixtae]|uniref:Uncharacterized protein n=1 Tax=Albidovulum aquaemixtae TaxID=1542388 RepID=A0A2R8BIZ1_9RHOB|nr:hypothetical protein [Defluviimonas aquaemixtae]SPH23322.1 hypothetical protein DEA8626_02386 [Defluviimonas aquaemixtae]
MPGTRLLALITALVLVGGNSPARADYTVSQLEEIERLIVRKDCGALWLYLQANPGIMAGGDALSLELRAFADATARGQIDCFDAPTAQTSVPAAGPVVNFAESAY